MEEYYKQLRLESQKERNKLLIEVGLVGEDETHLFASPSVAVKKPVAKPKKRSRSLKPSRRSDRVRRSNSYYQHSPVRSSLYSELESDADSDYDAPVRKRPPLGPRKNFYGAVEGVKVGTTWPMRIDCCYDGVHRPTVCGIHPGQDGAYSVAISGNYEDDVDDGDTFIYTGCGGRDLKGTKTNPKNLRTAPQTKHQNAQGYNAALIRSVETQNPVRVIRGYKGTSIYAPEEGYRYDGLYTVEKYWKQTGKAGFDVYKFRLVRRKDQDPAPWHPDFRPLTPPRKQSKSSSRVKRSAINSVTPLKDEDASLPKLSGRFPRIRLRHTGTPTTDEDESEFSLIESSPENTKENISTWTRGRKSKISLGDSALSSAEVKHEAVSDDDLISGVSGKDSFTPKRKVFQEGDSDSSPIIGKLLKPSLVLPRVEVTPSRVTRKSVRQSLMVKEEPGKMVKEEPGTKRNLKLSDDEKPIIKKKAIKRENVFSEVQNVNARERRIPKVVLAKF